MTDEQDNAESERQARLKAAEEKSAKAREDNERRLAETKAKSEATAAENERRLAKTKAKSGVSGEKAAEQSAERLAATKARSEAAAEDNERRLAEIKSRSGKTPTTFAFEGKATSLTGENAEFSPQEPKEKPKPKRPAKAEPRSEDKPEPEPLPDSEPLAERPRKKTPKSPKTSTFEGKETSITGEDQPTPPTEGSDVTDGGRTYRKKRGPQTVEDLDRLKKWSAGADERIARDRAAAGLPPGEPGPSSPQRAGAGGGIADNTALNAIKTEIVSKLNELIAAVKAIGGPFGE